MQYKLKKLILCAREAARARGSTNGGRVQVSCGARDGELVFKISKPGQDSGGGKGCGYECATRKLIPYSLQTAL